jgi:hypothetical protein
MTHPLTHLDRIEVAPDAYLAEVGEVFARFDERTQDSGNRSYGVAIGDDRYFVKTAGPPEDTRWYLGHAGRARCCATPPIWPAVVTMARCPGCAT